MRRQLPLCSSTQRPSAARLRLLTYPMALAQPNATVPLLQGVANTAGADRATSTSRSGAMSIRVRQHGVSGDREFMYERGLADPRRWVRGPEELCVASLRRSRNVNRVNAYVATYKFDDPQWAPLLLPEVTLRPRENAVSGDFTQAAASGMGDKVENASSSSSSSVSPPVAPPPSSPPFLDGDDDYKRGNRITINHNKLVMLECMARHVNFSLRHIVQKGHGVYLLHHAQHSVLRPKGIVEQSFVTCSFGIRGERLRTDIVHVGPLDAADVVDVNVSSHGRACCTFNFQKPDIPRGVVAVSQVEGYGTWFQRKPMLWQRSRRIGALQSQLGAFAYDLVHPHTVGKRRDCEVFFLAPHMRFYGDGASGVEAVGIIASSQVAQQDRLYLGEFEAPAMVALDAVHQLAHASALRCQLVTPVDGGSDGSGGSDGGCDVRDTTTCGSETAMETLLPMSWATRTPPPYVPLEADLPFKLQMSRPVVIAERKQQDLQQVYPTGGTVGSPFVFGAPLVLFEYNLHQGVDHYTFDDAPSARPMKWWSQKSNLPYSGYMYFVRSGMVDCLMPSEDIPNPLESVERRRPLHAIVPPTKEVQRRIKRYKQKSRESDVGIKTKKK